MGAFVSVWVCSCERGTYGDQKRKSDFLALELLASHPKCVLGTELRSSEEQSRSHVSNLSAIYSLIIYKTFFLFHTSLQVIPYKYFGLSPDLGKHPAGKQNPCEVS